MCVLDEKSEFLPILSCVSIITDNPQKTKKKKFNFNFVKTPLKKLTTDFKFIKIRVPAESGAKQKSVIIR